MTSLVTLQLAIPTLHKISSIQYVATKTSFNCWGVQLNMNNIQNLPAISLQELWLAQ